MEYLDNIIKASYETLVGEIPQVHAAFVHHFGEERIDLVYQGDSPIDLTTPETYFNSIKKSSWKKRIKFATDNAISNKFILAKINSLILEDDTLDISEESLREFEGETKDNIILDIIKIYKKYVVCK
jgi:hypothetical protein